MVARSELLKLEADEFENLICDLMILHGLKNATWRTPGADGGRDIEGNFNVIDFSGNFETQKWYIECKRYSKSVDWPTVYHKIAHADNHKADYLMFCTTANLSPACKTEITTWNNNGRKPKIRYWDVSELIRKIDKEPVIRAKYGFDTSDVIAELSVLPLTKLTAKVIQSTYGFISGDPSFSPVVTSIEYSAALVELIFARVEWVKAGHSKFVRPFVADRDGYEWFKVEVGIGLDMFDGYGLRALITAIRYYGKMEFVNARLRQQVIPAEGGRSEGGEILEGFSVDLGWASLPSPVVEAFKTIAMWSRFDLRFLDTVLEVLPRRF